MIAVDLIPEELKAGKHRRKRLRVWLMAVIATTIAVFVWAAMNYMTLRREDLTIRQLARQSQDIENSIESTTEHNARLCRGYGKGYCSYLEACRKEYHPEKGCNAR